MLNVSLNSSNTLVLVYHRDSGFSEHMICVGLIYYMCQFYLRVIVTVHRQDLRAFKALFNHINHGGRIRPLIVDSHLFISDEEIRRTTNPAAEILRLGVGNGLEEGYRYHPFAPLSSVSYPEKLYADAGVAYAVRWSHFRLERDMELEDSVLKLSEVSTSQPYALVIEDISKQVYVDTSDVPKGMHIVRLQEAELILGGTLVDHALLMQRATIIHAADGALARLAEHLPTSAEMKVLP
jgi:hypothetical protein